MSGVRVEGFDRAVALLDEMGTRARDLRPILRVIAEDLKTLTDDSFRGSKTPTGRQWEPLSEETIAQRRKGSRKPLIDTGRLRSSITTRVESRLAEVGTNVVYAGTHQFGSRHVPARPFLPFDASGAWAGSEAHLSMYGDWIARYIETGQLG